MRQRGGVEIAKRARSIEIGSEARPFSTVTSMHLTRTAAAGVTFRLALLSSVVATFALACDNSGGLDPGLERESARADNAIEGEPEGPCISDTTCRELTQAEKQEIDDLIARYVVEGDPECVQLAARLSSMVWSGQVQVQLTPANPVGAWEGNVNTPNMNRIGIQEGMFGGELPPI
jgi:hypothetical protein